MRRKVCKRCGEYFDENFEGKEHAWHARWKNLGALYDNRFEGEYHGLWKRNGWGDCGPLILVDFDDYWEQMEAFIGTKI